MSIPIDTRSMQLPASQYFAAEYAKSLVVLHHTAGGSESSSVAWWRQDPARIATAFIIGRDGSTFRCFHPAHWAYHLGIGGAIEKRSIGIELANWGPLKKTSDGRFLNWAGRVVQPADVLEMPWRGERYWERYPEAQIKAAIELTADLVSTFGIDPDVAPWPTAAPDLRRWRAFEGVIAHCHVRADKTDLSPVFPWRRLETAIGAMRPPDVHVVQQGETLYAIAQRYGVTVNALMATNGIRDARNLRVGQHLRIR